MSACVVDVSPFVASNIPESGFILILGKRGRGKTNLAKYLSSLWKYRDIGMPMVIAGSEAVKTDWETIVPRLFINDISIQYLQKIIDDQNSLVKKYKLSRQEFPKYHEKFLFIDDGASCKTFIKSPAFLYLASNSRHLHITTIVLAQYMYQLTSEVRYQFDLIMALATSNKRNIQTLHNEFCNSVDVRVFRSVLTATTESFGACVIDNRADGNDISRVISYVRAPFPLPVIKVGSEEMWNFSKIHYLDLDKLRDQKNILREKLRVQETFVDSEDEHDNNELFETTYKLIDNKRMFHDRYGSILIRHIPPNITDTATVIKHKVD